MNPTPRYLLVVALLLLSVGCAGYDDRAEQSEFERLRKYPIAPQGDRMLPDFGTEPSSDDESLRYAIYSDGRIPKLLAEGAKQKDGSRRTQSFLGAKLAAVEDRATRVAGRPAGFTQFRLPAELRILPHGLEIALELCLGGRVDSDQIPS